MLSGSVSQRIIQRMIFQFILAKLPPKRRQRSGSMYLKEIAKDVSRSDDVNVKLLIGANCTSSSYGSRNGRA